MAKYTILYGWCKNSEIKCETWAEVKTNLKGLDNVTVIGEGYDCDCDEDGFHVKSTGLTEEQDEIDSLI